MSAGSVSSVRRQVSSALAAPAAEAACFVRRQLAQHVDETGWRECGLRKWLWVNAAADVTVFEVLSGRGAAEARQVLDAARFGDGACARRVKKLLETGARCGSKKTRRTCANLLAVEGCLWTFVRVAGVEPTNNAAERALRRAVRWRRKSFGTQSAEGSRFVGRVLTAVASLRQQGRDVPEYLARVCAGGGPDGVSSMRLLPQPPSPEPAVSRHRDGEGGSDGTEESSEEAAVSTRSGGPEAGGTQLRAVWKEYQAAGANRVLRPVDLRRRARVCDVLLRA
jgi:transposase